MRTQEGVAIVKLNRPEKRNGLDLAMFESIIEAASKFKRRIDPRGAPVRRR